MYILTIFYIIICTCLFIIVLYPLNIYELISYSKVYDIYDILNNKYNTNLQQRLFIMLQNNIIQKQSGIYTYNFLNNTFNITLHDRKYTFSLNEIDKIIPIVKLSTPIDQF